MREGSNINCKSIVNTPDLWAELELDPKKETTRISTTIAHQTHKVLKRRGLVVGLSGGVDSSVVAALAVEALGPDRVLGLLMPERESSASSFDLGKRLAEHLRIRTLVEDITATLESAGCYVRRDTAIARVIPGFDTGDRCKLVRPGLLSAANTRLFSVVVESKDGSIRRARLPPAEYRLIVASTCLKQRVRKMMEYHHADRLDYGVAGTANRLEYALGFFVRGGDGLADIKPIAHLYKSQVYSLAEYLGIPTQIREMQPTTDTYPMEASQEEFYFGLSHRLLDLCLHAKSQGFSPEQVAEHCGLTVEQIHIVNGDLRGKMLVSQRLNRPPMLVDPVYEMSPEQLDDSVSISIESK